MEKRFKNEKPESKPSEKVSNSDSHPGNPKEAISAVTKDLKPSESDAKSSKSMTFTQTNELSRQKSEDFREPVSKKGPEKEI